MQDENLADQGLELQAEMGTIQRRQAAELLRPVLRALAQIIATDHRPVLLLSQKAEVLLANRPSQRLGLTRDSLLARLGWTDLTARAKRAGSAPLVWQAGEQSYDGELVPVPLGPATGFLLRLAETDQEATLLRNQARAASLMRVAHDLRTPIQALLAAVHPLLEPGASAPDPGEAERMRRAAGLALDHISNVLAVIRGGQNVSDAQAEEDFRLGAEISHLVEMVHPIARARSAELALTLNAPADLTLHGPLSFVRALVQNLIDNSVNHGGGRVDLTVSADPLPRAAEEPEAPDLWRIKLELCDEGGGLPSEQRARLSEALGLPLSETGPHLAAPDRRPSAGLNVLAQALRQLGGQIRIEDRLLSPADARPTTAGTPVLPATEIASGALPPAGAARIIGTRFIVTFTLPGAPDLPVARPLRTAPDAPSLTGRTLVLVEDSPASRDWLAHVLQSAGAEVIAVSSAPEALALLQREAFATKVDLVLTDVTLPRINGIELARRLLGGDQTAAQPWFGHVVGLTAHADERIRAAGLQAGMSIVLEKPIQPSRLVRHLVDILAGSPYLTSEDPAAKAAGDVIDPEVSANLIAELGLSATLSFMQRALSEATSVYDELRLATADADTGRRLHAATGASGLTGMIMVEQRLRQTEAAFDAKDPALGSVIEALGSTLAQTRQAIDAMRPAPISSAPE